MTAMSPGRAIAVLLVALAASLAAVVVDAYGRRAARSDAATRAAVLASGGADLALSSASRWLRHPLASEPGAAFADAPAAIDVDPASLLVPPPRGVYAASSRDVARRAR